MSTPERELVLMTTEPQTANGVPGACADSLPFVRCDCGYMVAGQDEDNNRLVAANHDCPNLPPKPWYGYVFSLWGTVVAAVVGIVLVAILTHGTGA